MSNNTYGFQGHLQSLFAGQNLGLEQNKKEADTGLTLEQIAASQQRREFEKELHPLEMEKRRGDIAQQGATLESTRLGNQEKQEKLNWESANRFNEALGNLMMTGSISDVAKIVELAKKFNLDPDHPFVSAAMAAKRGTPEDWDKFNKSFGLGDPRHRQALAAQEALADRQEAADRRREARAEREIRLRGEEARKLEMLRIQGRIDAMLNAAPKEVNKNLQQAYTAHLNTLHKLNGELKATQDPQEQARLVGEISALEHLINEMLRIDHSMRSAAAGTPQAGKPDVAAIIGTPPAAAPSPPQIGSQPGQGQPLPPAPLGPQSDGSFRGLINRAGPPAGTNNQGGPPAGAVRLRTPGS